jgi:hypothetical protein
MPISKAKSNGENEKKIENLRKIGKYLLPFFNKTAC